MLPRFYEYSGRATGLGAATSGWRPHDGHRRRRRGRGGRQEDPPLGPPEVPGGQAEARLGDHGACCTSCLSLSHTYWPWRAFVAFAPFLAASCLTSSLRTLWHMRVDAVGQPPPPPPPRATRQQRGAGLPVRRRRGAIDTATATAVDHARQRVEGACLLQASVRSSLMSSSDLSTYPCQPFTASFCITITAGRFGTGRSS